MRITSPFHDYYDSGLALGQDQTLLYVRTPMEVEEFNFTSASWKPHFRDERDNKKGFKEIITHIVGFCDKIYPILEIATWKDDKKHFFIKLEEIDKFVQENYRERELDDFHAHGRYSWYRRHPYWPWNQNHGCLAKFFELIGEVKDCKKTLQKHKCPLFVATCTYDKRKTVYNGRLKDVQFFRYLDPYTAFQEIYMWLSNQAVPQKEIPVPSDKDMVGIKGFDKFNFRKDKSK